jgi:hypothetical protein
VNLALLSALRLHSFQGDVAVRAEDPIATQVLEDAGANLVLVPLRDGAKEAVDLLTAR